MNRKLTKEDELEVYKQVLRGTRQSLVAKQFDISQGWVSTIYKNITKINDENLAVSTALQYIGGIHQTVRLRNHEAVRAGGIAPINCR